MARFRRNASVERRVHGPAAFRYEFDDRGILKLVYQGFRSPDGHVLLKLDAGKSYNYSYPKVLPPAQIVVRSPEDALNQAIRMRSQASDLSRNAREGGFYERMGRLSTETEVALRELELEADILEDFAYTLAYTLEKRRQMGAHINPDYSKLSDDVLIEIALGERRGDSREAARELRRRGIIDDRMEMILGS